jgi:hypothetical protein
LVEIAASQGYQLTVPDLETLRHGTQEQAQLIPIGFGFGTNETSIRQKQPKAIVSFLNPIGINSDEFGDDELSEQELELVAGGFLGPVPITISLFPNWPPRRPSC